MDEYKAFLSLLTLVGYFVLAVASILALVRFFALCSNVERIRALLERGQPTTAPAPVATTRPVERVPTTRGALLAIGVILLVVILVGWASSLSNPGKSSGRPDGSAIPHERPTPNPIQEERDLAKADAEKAARLKAWQEQGSYVPPPASKGR